MPFSLIDVTGPDYWKPLVNTYDWGETNSIFIWEDGHWDYNKDYDGLGELQINADGYTPNVFWDVLGIETLIYGMAIDFRNLTDLWNPGVCELQRNYINDITGTVQVYEYIPGVGEASVEILPVLTSTGIGFDFVEPVQVQYLTRLKVLMVGDYYCGPCGQSYISKIQIKVDAEPQHQHYWSNFHRTAEVI